jgi:hypothetical protein
MLPVLASRWPKAHNTEGQWQIKAPISLFIIGLESLRTKEYKAAIPEPYLAGQWPERDSSNENLYKSTYLGWYKKTKPRAHGLKAPLHKRTAVGKARYQSKRIHIYPPRLVTQRESRVHRLKSVWLYIKRAATNQSHTALCRAWQRWGKGERGKGGAVKPIRATPPCAEIDDGGEKGREGREAQ